MTGGTWGFEVKLPSRLQRRQAGRTKKQPLRPWAQLGRPPRRRPRHAADGNAGLILPAGVNGPAFLVTKNFDAIYAYNAAESYALAIAHLSDRLRGGGPFVTPWPTDDRGLSRAERRELQALLLKRGYDIGDARRRDRQHAKTKLAIADVQVKLGLEPHTGRVVSGKVYDALRTADAGRASASPSPACPPIASAPETCQRLLLTTRRVAVRSALSLPGDSLTWS